jgi:hypothetical protein
VIRPNPSFDRHSFGAYTEVRAAGDFDKRGAIQTDRSIRVIPNGARLTELRRAAICTLVAVSRQIESDRALEGARDNRRGFGDS